MNPVRTHQCRDCGNEITVQAKVVGRGTKGLVYNWPVPYCGNHPEHFPEMAKLAENRIGE